MAPAVAGADPLPDGWPATIAPEHVLAAKTLELTGDGMPELALVVRGEEDADLLLWQGDPFGLKPVAIARGIVWAGAAAGQIPTLEATAGGSLSLRAGNEGIGRHRWFETLTLAWRDDALLVAGYGYTAYDTLKVAMSTHCDANLLTGRGMLDDEPMRFAPRRVTVGAFRRADHAPCGPESGGAE